MSNILSVIAAASRVLQGVAQDIATADNCIKNGCEQFGKQTFTF